MEEEVVENGIEKLDLDISGDNYIYQESTLPRSAYDLTLYENRILSVVASKMRPNDGPDQCYYFRIQDFAKLFSLNNVYDNLQDNLLRLRSRSFVVKRKDENSARITGWIREAEIIPASGIVQVTIDPRVRPYFLEIKKALGYFKYKLDNVRAFSNSSAFRLYVRMKAEFKGKRTATITMTIPEFRAWMNFKKEYTRYADLKRRIIIPAIEDINGIEHGKKKATENHSDISISFVEIFESRKIAGIMFKAVLLDPSAVDEGEESIDTGNGGENKKTKDEREQTIDTYFTSGGHVVPGEEEKKAIEYFLGLKIERKVIKEAVKNFGIENIKYIAQYVIAKMPSITISPSGYAVSALKGGFGIINKTEKENCSPSGAKNEIVPSVIQNGIDQDENYRSKYEQDAATVDDYLRSINEDEIGRLVLDCKRSLTGVGTILFRSEDALTQAPSKAFFYNYVMKTILGLE